MHGDLLADAVVGTLQRDQHADLAHARRRRRCAHRRRPRVALDPAMRRRVMFSPMVAMASVSADSTVLPPMSAGLQRVEVTAPARPA
jgi:hypothetical protein